MSLPDTPLPLCVCRPTGDGSDVWETGGKTIRFVSGDVLDRASYERAGVASATAVILGSLQVDDAKDADARMLSRWAWGQHKGDTGVEQARAARSCSWCWPPTCNHSQPTIHASLPSSPPPTHTCSLLMVQDVVNVSGTGRPPHIVASVHFPETAATASHILTELARTRLSAELLQPSSLVSGMLLQVAHEPSLAATLSELIDSCIGSELVRGSGRRMSSQPADGLPLRASPWLLPPPLLMPTTPSPASLHPQYLRRPTRYGLDGTHSFAEVCELARLRGETCIGFLTGGADGRLVLVPEATSTADYNEDARIIVLSES